ncbi:MAG TPA: lactate utilization protein [Candidatus Deferrimicrobiaceae bacterium]|nr:lactate utilization protein [Candidatus Deferrimicrobiaceae bacterium]
MSRVEIGLWQLEVRARRCVEALRKNGFDAEYYPALEGLRERVFAECDRAESIGFGGSLSVAEMGVYDALAPSGKKLFDHGRVPKEEKAAARLGQLTCDLFLTGTNAVTLDGCLVNLDMNGNRTNAMTFGPKKIIVVAGGQKVVAGVPEAIRRIKSVAAPRNTKRLGLDTPCATSGFCENCDHPQRICRVYSIIERKPPHSDISVLLCGEPLGL